MRIKLTKLRDVPKPDYPNNRPIGEITEGNMTNRPMVGQVFILTETNRSGWFQTSTVTKIVNDHTFETLNSVYVWQIIRKF